ncbi:hypothetical protein Tco_1232406, partial [Tanacetum coccineum]
VKGSDEELQSDMDTSTRKFEVICAKLEEPLKLDVPVNIVATKDLDVSHRGGTCDVMKITENIDASHKQGGSEFTKEGEKKSDVKDKFVSVAPRKEEIAESGVKLNEPNEE